MNSPPAAARWILEKFLEKAEREHLLGDFEEFYHEMLGHFGGSTGLEQRGGSNGLNHSGRELAGLESMRKNKSRADQWYWRQVLRTLPKLAGNIIYWRTTMFWNYMKTAFRNLSRQKAYSLINILGLSVGLSIFILAMLYVNFYLTYDRFHEDADRIYCCSRVDTRGREGTFAPIPLSGVLRQQLPEVEAVTTYLQSGTRNITCEGTDFVQPRVRWADNDFFKVFSFEMLSGDRNTALDGPNKVVLTRTTANKYFGDENPIGKTITYEKNTDFEVTGVVEDHPLNSSVTFNLIFSYDTIRESYDNWEYISPVILKLAEGADRFATDQKLATILKDHVPESENAPVRLFLYPLTKMIYRPAEMGAFSSRTELVQQLTIVVTALLLLIVVCLNFTSLSTARYLTRAREVGLRKVLGASRRQLISQFLGESVLIAMISLPLALIMYRLLVPMFLTLMGMQIDMNIMTKPVLLVYCFLTALVAGLLAGSYPALFVSAFQPAAVFKGDLKSFLKGTAVRKTLIVAQFTLAIVMMIFSVVFNRQSEHLLQADLGYDRSDVMVVDVHAHAMHNLEIFKDEIADLPGVVSAANSTYIPCDVGNRLKMKLEGHSDESAIAVEALPIDYGLLETLDMPVLKGRSFSEEFKSTDECVISKMAAGRLGLDDPIGQRVKVGDSSLTVVGLIDDFHFDHVFYKMQPGVLSLQDSSFSLMLVETASPDIIPALKEQMTAKWAEIAPGRSIEFSMLDDRFTELFRDTVKGQDLMKVFSAISVMFSVFGLIGLASYTIEKQKKEIALRKILGASTSRITRTFILRFLILVGISNAIGWPLAWYAARYFVNFAWVTRINVGIDIFLFAGLTSVVTAVAVVFFQAWRAAVRNPVDSLRYE